MKKFTHLAIASICTCLLFAGTVTAKNKKGVLEGEYVPINGGGESTEVSRPALGELPNQLGTFKIKLKRVGWNDLSKEDKKRIAKKVVIEGVFRGQMKPDFTFEHTLVNEDRTGIMYTKGDFLILSQGDLFCSSGVPLKGTEQLNLVGGSGDYAGLSTGTIYLSVTVNNCFGENDFLKNELKVNEDVGSVVFAPL